MQMHAYDISVRILLSALLLNYLEPDSCRHDESCILSSHHTRTQTHSLSCSLAVYFWLPRPSPPRLLLSIWHKTFSGFCTHHISVYAKCWRALVCMFLCGRLCGSACLCVCMCVRVPVWGKWEAYFTPFAAAHQNKHKQMRVSVLLSLGSATTQLGLLPLPPSSFLRLHPLGKWGKCPLLCDTQACVKTKIH